MANGTIIQQGYFTSDGTSKIIPIRSDVDWVEVRNLTNIAGSDQWAGTEWYWQRGMTNGDALVNFHATASQIISQSTCVVGFNGATYEGISLIDSSVSPVGALTSTITAISNASPPVATVSSAHGMANGDVVRLINVVGGQQLGGVDFTVAVVDSTHFSLVYMDTIVAATTGSFRKISFDPLYYPRKRFVSKVTAAASAVVTLTVTHGYTVGQKVRFYIPAEYGMVELDKQDATITAINTTTNTVTLDLDSSGFTAFAFPLTAESPFTPAIMVPVGEGIEEVTGKITLDDATYNTGYIGIKLGTSGTAAIALGSAGGSNGDAIKWRAGKSFNL